MNCPLLMPTVACKLKMYGSYIFYTHSAEFIVITTEVSSLGVDDLLANPSRIAPGVAAGITDILPTVLPHKNPPQAGATRNTVETILALRQWTPNLLSFRTTRSAGFRFTPGHYTRLGLIGANGSMVWRPFSVVSSAHDSHLEFFAVLVPGGDFSVPLSGIHEGEPIHVDKTSYGFMTIDHFAPGSDLWLLASGTGLGPFVSILRDPVTWQSYDRLIVVHSVRCANELAYREEIASIPHEELVKASPGRLRYLPVVTRQACAGALPARIPQLIADGRLEQAAAVTLDPQHSRIMVCGNPEMTRELRGQLTARGFQTNRRAAPAQLAFENYWQSTSL
jgi:ferredoxin/flavodoxin---NADP+ reductase